MSCPPVLSPQRPHPPHAPSFVPAAYHSNPHGSRRASEHALPTANLALRGLVSSAHGTGLRYAGAADLAAHPHPLSTPASVPGAGHHHQLLHHAPREPLLRCNHQLPQFAHQQQQHPHHAAAARRATPLAMSTGQALPPSDQEMAYLQKLSNEWQPEASGPLVGERQSSSAIATEYATADPIYRQKTANLPNQYSHYRTCRGDGHCGWRAMAFSYFEALQRIGDRHKFLEEETRLRSFGNLLAAVGHEEHLYEDFADEMYNLLRETAEHTPALDNGAALLAAFNDENRSMAIITFLKILTSAWIQTRADQYEPFIQEPAREYCLTKIEPVMSEIEHVGVSALCELLAKPAGIAVEILYLDRSPGDLVNTYRFDPADIGITAPEPPTIRMLYRPGHYDILYKPEDIPQPILQPNNITHPVYLAMPTGSDQIASHNHPEYVPEFLDDIPGLSRPTFAPSTWYSSDFVTSTLPTAPIAATPALPTPTMPAPTFSQMPVAQLPQPQKYGPPMALDPPIGLPLSAPMMIDRDGGPFRPSVWQMEPDFATSQNHMQFQTSIFRNSHFNTAHFRNPDFQPEEWSPDAEYSSNSGKSSLKHKSSG